MIADPKDRSSVDGTSPRSASTTLMIVITPHIIASAAPWQGTTAAIAEVAAGQ